jgi:hypothetical protein
VFAAYMQVLSDMFGVLPRSDREIRRGEGDFAWREAFAQVPPIS